MPTEGHEGHDPGRPDVPAHPSHQRDSEHPGYETQDVNVRGIVTFLAGLCGSLVVFFFLCFAMGKVINWGLEKTDGQAARNSVDITQPGVQQGKGREDLTSNDTMQQRSLDQMAKTFPTPVLENDDGLQNVAELHAREDLLLNFNSTSSDLPAGTVRIPITRAMELIVQRGLGAPAVQPQQARPLMAGENAPAVTAPLTDGFARTGYELETIDARHQKLEYETGKKE